MKVLHLLYSGLGGHGNVFFSFLDADKERIFDYEAIFAGVETAREEYIAKCNAGNITWKYIQKRKGLDRGFSRQLIAALKDSRSSIIFLHGSRFILLAKIAVLLSKNKKSIIVRETQANHLKTWLDWLWLILAILLADRIVFLTENFKDEIRKKLAWIYRSQKISVISNGIDLAIFKPAAKPATTTIVLGMQSRIVPIKDHTTLLHAFALLVFQHPELSLQLKIAGEGESLPQMLQLCGQLKIENKVQFTGVLNETDLVSFMQSLDIYIHASLGETMSTAIMQAMACRLPIVASDVPGIRNMIENNTTGLLVPVKNKAALADAVYFLITHPAKAEAMKTAAFNFAQSHYSNKTMFAKYHEIINLLMR